jgi:hypothetical protein
MFFPMTLFKALSLEIPVWVYSLYYRNDKALNNVFGKNIKLVFTVKWIVDANQRQQQVQNSM